MKDFGSEIGFCGKVKKFWHSNWAFAQKREIFRMGSEILKLKGNSVIYSSMFGNPEPEKFWPIT